MSFDWSKVDGYREDMTPEEKLGLLDNYEMPEPTNEEPEPAPAPTPAPALPKAGYIPKAQFDKLSSELAAAKKQLKSKMSDDEQREMERQAEQEAMREELKALQREKMISTYKAAYMTLGYDGELAEEAATSMTDGDMDTVFAAMKKQSLNAEKELRAKLLKETPVPPANQVDDEQKKKAQEASLRKAFGLPVY